jgi:hypothetical protein
MWPWYNPYAYSFYYPYNFYGFNPYWSYYGFAPVVYWP